MKRQRMPNLTETEVQRLAEIWPTATKEEINQEFPGRNYKALSNQMYKRGVKCLVERNAKGTVTPLLSNTQESWYWLGFIMADGHITKDNQILVMISEHDKNHLEKLATFLNTEVKYPYKNFTESGYGSKTPPVRVAVADKKLVPEIVSLLGLTSTKKTYNPISLLNVPKEFRASFLIGFIDGDGSITEEGYTVRIENHITWKDFHEEVCNEFGFKFVANKPNTSRIVGNKNTLLSLAVHIKMYNLPVMERKWERVNEKL